MGILFEVFIDRNIAFQLYILFRYLRCAFIHPFEAICVRQ